MPPLSDLTGMEFGRLVVVSRDQNRGRRVAWLCRCECGSTCIARGSDLSMGKHRSCGCLQVDRATRHGHTSRDTRKISPTYRSWVSMIQRCTNPKATAYHRYGGRGITVCERWLESFDAFLEDMGERPEGMTLDRRDDDSGYSPDNCRWATRKEQSRNRCDNRRLEYDGETRSVAEWSELLGIGEGVIRGRLKLGWPFERIATTPVLRGDDRDRDPITGRWAAIPTNT